MTKPTADKSVEADDEKLQYSTINCTPMACPLAGKKLTKKLLKTVRKAAKQKHVKRGVKEVSKALRKGEKGLVVLAGDIYPHDVISHLPIMCEEIGVTYCYVPSKSLLGAAACTKRPTSVLMVSEIKKKGAEYEEALDACAAEMKELPVLPVH